jgi:hypothetical protein
MNFWEIVRKEIGMLALIKLIVGIIGGIFGLVVGLIGGVFGLLVAPLVLLFVLIF